MVFCIVICEVFVMNGYITVQEAALKWGISPRQVQLLRRITPLELTALTIPSRSEVCQNSL